MRRIYHAIIEEHLARDNQMIFLAGPRQVGKTTISRSIEEPANTLYLNWDVKEHRAEILKGALNVGKYTKLDEPKAHRPLLVFDELHKFKKWRQFLKGFYDLYQLDCNIIVTGSAKFDIYRRGGDSLMGRYFPYRVHPLSVREIITTEVPAQPLSHQAPIRPEDFERLWFFGGYPDPYIKSNTNFSKRWQKLRHDQLFNKDIKDLTNIQEIDQLEILATIIQENATKALNYTTLSQRIGVAVNTVKRWLSTLKHFYYCFTISPWSNNISRSLVKEPKVFLWDWSEITDIGSRVENFVACHLHKAIHAWNDLGFGNFGLYYIRDKEKNEVDFLLVRDNQPWVLIEVKHSANHSISKNLYHFQEVTGAQHALQVVFDMEYRDIDCFSYTKPIMVPLITFLSQLI